MLHETPHADDKALLEDLASATAECIAETTSISQVAASIRRLIDKYVASDVSQILIHDGEKLRLLDSKPKGLSHVPLEKSVCSEAIKAGGPILLGDWRSSPYKDIYAETVPDMTSELAVPVFDEIEGERTAFAVVNLEHSRADHFTADHCRRVQLISRFAVVLLRHADFAELSRASQEAIAYLYQNTQDVSTAFRQAIGSMVELAGKWHKAGHQEFVMFETPADPNATPDRLRILYSTREEDIGTSLEVSKAACSLALTTRPGEIIYFPDLREASPVPHHESYKSARSLVIVPLRHADRVVGAIYVAADAPRSITPFARLLFRQIGTHTAPLIELIRLIVHHRHLVQEHQATKDLAFHLCVNTTHIHNVRHDVNQTASRLTSAVDYVRRGQWDVNAMLADVEKQAARLAGAAEEYEWVLSAMARTDSGFNVWQAAEQVGRSRLIADRLAKAGTAMKKAVSAGALSAQAVCPGFEAAVYCALDNATKGLEKLPPAQRSIAMSANEAIDSQGRACVELVISDHGPGMSEEQRQQLFAFPGREKVLRGSGYGMWFARLCIRSSGGDVTVRVNESGGTDVLYRVVIASEGVSDGQVSRGFGRG